MHIYDTPNKNIFSQIKIFVLVLSTTVSCRIIFKQKKLKLFNLDSFCSNSGVPYSLWLRVFVRIQYNLYSP